MPIGQAEVVIPVGDAIGFVRTWITVADADYAYRPLHLEGHQIIGVRHKPASGIRRSDRNDGDVGPIGRNLRAIGR